MTSPSLAPGTLLASKWIVGGLLGRTEWTEVFEAEETGGRVAGLKLFSAQLRSQPQIWEWFEGLCTTLTRLPATAIARIYDVGVEPRLSLGFVAGERMSPPNLGRLVSEKGPLSPRTFARALLKIGEALDATHGERVLHGNLKPQNVFVSPIDPDAARIMDFGGAQLRAGNGIYPALTLGWYAPEIDGGQASPAIDRYALGIVTFFALTGFPWFAALRGQPDGSPAKHALIAAVGAASERATSFGGALHPAFDAWFAQALAPDPAARFSTSTEMARAFEKTAIEAERAVGAAPAVPDSPPLSATIPIARPIDPALAAALSPAGGVAASIAPPAGNMPPPGASLRPSRTPGPVHRRSVLLFALLGGALVLATLGVLWGITRLSDDAEADAASSASSPAAESAAPAAQSAAPITLAPLPAATAASAAPATDPPPAPAPAPPPAATAKAALASSPATPKTAAPKATTTAKATATTKTAATQPKATAGVKATASTKTSASKTKKKCGTFLKCK